MYAIFRSSAAFSSAVSGPVVFSGSVYRPGGGGSGPDRRDTLTSENGFLLASSSEFKKTA